MGIQDEVLAGVPVTPPTVMSRRTGRGPGPHTKEGRRPALIRGILVLGVCTGRTWTLSGNVSDVNSPVPPWRSEATNVTSPTHSWEQIPTMGSCEREPVEGGGTQVTSVLTQHPESQHVRQNRVAKNPQGPWEHGTGAALLRHRPSDASEDSNSVNTAICTCSLDK